MTFHVLVEFLNLPYILLKIFLKEITEDITPGITPEHIFTSDNILMIDAHQ